MERLSSPRRSRRPRLVLLVLGAVLVGPVAATSPAGGHGLSPAAPRARSDLEAAAKIVKLAVFAEKDALRDLRHDPPFWGSAQHELRLSVDLLEKAEADVSRDVAKDLDPLAAGEINSELANARTNDGAVAAKRPGRRGSTSHNIALIESALAYKTRALHKIGDAKKKQPPKVDLGITAYAVPSLVPGQSDLIVRGAKPFVKLQVILHQAITGSSTYYVARPDGISSGDCPHPSPTTFACTLNYQPGDVLLVGVAPALPTGTTFSFSVFASAGVQNGTGTAKPETARPCDVGSMSITGGPFTGFWNIFSRCDMETDKVFYFVPGGLRDASSATVLDPFRLVPCTLKPPNQVDCTFTPLVAPGNPFVIALSGPGVEPGKYAFEELFERSPGIEIEINVSRFVFQ